MNDRTEATPTLRDVVVAGGGIAGLALAVAIKRRRPTAAVTLCEPRGAPGGGMRAFAVAAGSRRFLDRLGAWAEIEPRAQPITRMLITDSRVGDHPRPTHLDFAGETGPGEPFAHMVMEEDLRAALRRACTELAVPILPLGVTGFDAGPGGLALRVPKGTSASTPQAFPSGDATAIEAVVPVGATGAVPLRARLLVAADGGRSRLRDLAGIPTVGWDYDQAGLVATLSHAVGHEGHATQHFLPGGPLAVLPLRAQDGSDRRFSLVWTVATAEARRLLALPRAGFVEALEEAIGHGYGALRLEDGPSAHPLRLMLPRRLVAARFALLGDAARVIHPLAGQGLNLGLRDAAALCDLVDARLSLGLDPGDAATLRAYEQTRRFDGFAMAAATDGLNRLFSNDILPLRLIRDLGLGVVDRLPGLKRRLMRDAAGLDHPLRPAGDL